MADSIVERLRQWDDGRISTHYEGCWDSHPVCAILLAADAIEARDAEIVRLRAAGDALARVATGYWLLPDEHVCSELWNGMSYDCECGMVWLTFANVCPSAEAVRKWEEARRGD